MDEKLTGQDELPELFLRYREACPEVEPGPNFMPELWARIEARQGFWPAFELLARRVVTGCAAACLVLVLLNVAASHGAQDVSEPTYADALVADQSAEATYYAEAVRVSPAAWEPSR